MFWYPSGLIYVETFLVAVLHQLHPSVSLVTSAPPSSEALPEQFIFFYAGRAFVAVIGAVMVIPTYLAARSVSNVIGGITAAVAIAIAPLAVTNSHYLTTDVPSAALAVLTLWLSLRGLAGNRRWLVAAGFAAGLAASTKYNAGLVVIVPLIVLLTSGPPRQLLRRPTIATAGLIVLAAMAGFVLLTPAVLLDASDVWTGGILYQLQAYSGGHLGAEGSDNAVYFLRVLWGEDGLGPGLFVLAGLGLIIAGVQHRRADVAVLCFVIAYYVMISLPPVRFDRNLLPLLPFFAVLAGRTIGWFVDLLTSHLRQLTDYRRRIPSLAAGLAIVAVAATPSFTAAVASDREFRTTDTRTIALDWIERNIPRGATIAREEYTPQIPASEYKVSYEQPLARQPLVWYRSRFDYLVASSQAFDRYWGHSPEDAFYSSLLALPAVLDLRPKAGQQGPRVVIVRLRVPASARLLAPGSG